MTLSQILTQIRCCFEKPPKNNLVVTIYNYYCKIDERRSAETMYFNGGSFR